MDFFAFAVGLDAKRRMALGSVLPRRASARLRGGGKRANFRALREYPAILQDFQPSERAAFLPAGACGLLTPKISASYHVMKNGIKNKLNLSKMHNRKIACEKQ
ncbi:MAG: hypothetical protein J6K14_01280 [Clostridia bacterium]|nr:hypothetical protein [Clostridia bacterium]